MSNISIEDIAGKTGNLYESVAIMAKRARQINDIQKRLMDDEREVVPQTEIRDLEDFDEVEIDREALMRDYVKYPKPTQLAIDQMMDDNIEFQHKGGDEEDTE